MPLFRNARDLIRKNLHQCSLGRKPRAVVIGSLTAVQLAGINAKRAQDNHPPLVAEVVFIGLHFYQSRALKDGYSIEDMLDQIEDGVPNLVEGYRRRVSAFYATACFAFTSCSPRKIAFNAQRSL